MIKKEEGKMKTKMKMKTKILILVLLLFFIFVLIFISLNYCGKTNNVKILIDKSEIYDEKEIESAINAVKKEFKYYWNCNLKTIEYDDDYTQKCIEKYTTDQIERKNLILILCNFNTGTNCPAGLSENSEYDNYEWLLKKKKKNGSWHIKERGY